MAFLQQTLRLTHRVNPRFRVSPTLHQSTVTLPTRTLQPRRAFSVANDAPIPGTSSPPSPTPPPKSTDDQLAGTAPTHQLYVFLHTPHPPSTYPAKFTTPVQRRLLMATMPYGGSVNFAWSECDSERDAGTGTGVEDVSTYRLTAFSTTRGKLEIDEVSLANVDQVGSLLQAHVQAPVQPHTSAVDDLDSDIHLYVCTHGARDCRCGKTGSAVANAIRAELDTRRRANPSDPSTRIRLAEVAHVGGHKYAANILVYPHGEWLGKVQPENVSEIIDAILETSIRPMHPDDMPLFPSYWRGRMGLSKEEQIALFNR